MRCKQKWSLRRMSMVETNDFCYRIDRKMLRQRKLVHFDGFCHKLVFRVIDISTVFLDFSRFYRIFSVLFRFFTFFANFLRFFKIILNILLLFISEFLEFSMILNIFHQFFLNLPNFPCFSWIYSVFIMLGIIFTVLEYGHGDGNTGSRCACGHWSEPRIKSKRNDFDERWSSVMAR